MADKLIVNKADFQFDYDGTTLNGESNEITTTVLDIVPTKAVDKAAILTSDDGILSYTVVFENTADGTLEKVMFSDIIPDGTTFIDDTLMLNGVALTLQETGDLAPMCYRIENGVLLANLGDCNSGETFTVTFKVQAQL